MPQRVLDAVWRKLSKRYRVKGQLQAPSDVAFELPVQFVHDVSREVELEEWTGDELNTGIAQ